MSDPGDAMLNDVLSEFRKLKRRAERAIAQVDDRSLFAMLDGDANSLAILMEHIGGNLRSRWTDFLTTDGEKPDRDRDREFVIEPDDTRARISERWETGWAALLSTLEGLQPADLQKIVYIRGEAHSVVQAINRALTHTSEHVGQIILLARHFAGGRWTTLSIPRGGSAAFNERLKAQGSGLKPA